MPKEDTSWTKGLKNRPEYTKEEVRLLASRPAEAQSFIDSTRDFGGASMSLKTMKMAQPGDSVYLVGKEPSKRTGEPVPTEFASQGETNPSLSAKQFAEHYLRLRGETDSPTAAMGSWVDEENKHKGVQIDLSSGYKRQSTAEKKMVERNEDAVWDMKNMQNIRHEDVRHKYTDTPRPEKTN